MKVHKLMKVILSFLTILFMLGSGNNNHTLAQGNQQGGRDVTDGTKIKITNFKIFRRGTSDEVNTLSTRTGYELQFDWDASAYGTTLKKGDYFTVKLPDAMNVDASQANKELDIKNEEDKVIARAVITGANGGGGNIKFTFSEVVDNLANIKGNFKMAFVLNETKVKLNEKNVLTVTVGVTNHPIVEGGILIKPAGKQDPTEELGKWAWDKVLKDFYDGTDRRYITDPDAIAAIKKGSTRWLLRVNVKGANLKNVVVSDKLHGDELGYVKIIPGTFVMYEGVANENGSATKIKNEKNISAQVNLAPDRKSFTYNLGNTEGKTYFIIYYTSFPEGSMLKVTNKAQITHEDGKSAEKTDRFKEAIAGGFAIGDNASRILITKVDADNTKIKLAKAKFKLYNENKQPVLGTDGQPIVLETNEGGIAQSEKLVEGTYYLEEIQAPENYLLPKDAGNNTENEGKDNFYKVQVTKDGAQLFIPNKYGGTSVSGEKTWNDNDDQDGKRPTKITVILKKTVDGQTSEVKRQDVTPNSEGEWKYEFTNLPLYENGKPIIYSVDEVDVPGYTKETTATAATRTTNGPDYNLTNKHEPEKRTIEGQKIWNDNNNQDGKRPTSIKVKLYKKVGNNNPEYVTEKVVTEGADKAWKWKFENLDKYENKQEIQYTVEEEVTNGYAGVVTGSMAAGFNITNSHTPETVNISGEKTWEDNNNQDGKRPESITVKLMKQVEGGQPEVKETKVVTKGQDDKWKYEFNNLPRYENGKLITYSIDEVDVPGYTKETTATRTTNGPDYNLTNKHEPEKRTIEGQKIWNDNNNQDGKRPTSIKVKLYKKVGNNNPEYVTEKVVTEGADKAWKWKFENLDKYENKQEIQYTVEEEVTNGYAGVVTGSMAAGFNITNSHTPETVNISGEKTWEDNNNQDGKRPESITVKLMKQVEGGQPEVKETKVVTKGQDDKWKYEFKNLPKYENGKLITYSIDEEAVTGYKKEITGNNLKNSYTPGKTKVQVTKAWEDKDNQDGVRPASVKVKLLADGVEVPGKTLTLTATNNWTGSFTDLDEYKAGNKIVYTVKEEEVGNGYDSKVIGSPEDGFKVINTRQTEKVNVEGTKTWNDADNQDGKRPTEIKINLLKNGTVVETKTVTEKDGWKWKFENLDKYANGEVINYTITEEAVENGYTSEITKTGENTFTVKNTREPEKTFVEGTKTWDDANNQDGKRPTKIKVTLYKKPIVLPRGEDDGRIKVAEKEVTQADDWKWKFENLDKYEAGQPIEYFVTEDPVEGYTTEINKVGKEDGRVEFNIVNKHLPEKAVVSGTKTWVDNNDQAGKRPGSIKVILNKTVDGKTTKVAEKEVTAKDNWNYEFTNLPKYENGKVIKYSIDEVDVPGYEKTIKGHNLENKYIPKKPGLPKTGSTPSEVGGLGVLGLLAGYVLIRRKNKAN